VFGFNSHLTWAAVTTATRPMGRSHNAGGDVFCGGAGSGGVFCSDFHLGPVQSDYSQAYSSWRITNSTPPLPPIANSSPGPHAADRLSDSRTPPFYTVNAPEAVRVDRVRADQPWRKRD